MARDLLAAWRAGKADPIRWVVHNVHGLPGEARAGEIPVTGVPFRTTDTGTQVVALRQGLGMATMPCFIGDRDAMLVRAPGADPVKYGTLWLLTQGETRQTKRVRLFTRFVARRLAAHTPLLAGLQPFGT